MKATDESAKANPTLPPTPVVKNKSSRGFLSIFIALLSLGAAGAALVLSLQQHANSAYQLEQALHGAEEAKEKEKTLWIQKLDATEKKVDALQETLNQTQQRLKHSMEQQQYHALDWVLLKARYVLELAQLNAHWGFDDETTRALLDQADSLLASLQETGLNEVRSAIATEKTALQRQAKADTTTLLNALNAAQSTLQQVKLHWQESPKETSNEMQAPKKNQSLFQKTWHYSLDALEKLVVIHHNQEDKPILSPMLAALVQNEIAFALLQAEYAVIQRNDALFHLFVEKAIKKVQQSYDPQEVNTIALLEQLGDMQKQTVSKSRIEMGNAIMLLNRYIESGAKNAATPTQSPDSSLKDKS